MNGICTMKWPTSDAWFVRLLGGESLYGTFWLMFYIVIVLVTFYFGLNLFMGR